MKKKKVSVKEYFEKGAGKYWHISSWGEHLSNILVDVLMDIIHKYHDGQREHGGKLYRRRVIEDLHNELLDIVIYWKTLEWQLTILEELIGAALSGRIDQHEALDAAYKLLRSGNIDGVEVEDE